MSTKILPIILTIIIIIIICVYILKIREKFYFQYTSFEIDSTEFIQRNSVEIGSFDGIQYWKVIGNVNGDVNGDTNKIILFINGNAGNITYRQEFFQDIIDNLGLPIYSLDYLAMKDKTIEKIIDLHIRFIKTHNKEKDIIIFGESIGNAIGLEIVNRTMINKFVFYAGFTRISDVIQHLSPIFIPFLNQIVTEFDNCKIIEKKIRDPNFKIVILHGNSDELIKFELIQTMANKFNIKLIELEGGHNDSIITYKDFNYIKANI